MVKKVGVGVIGVGVMGKNHVAAYSKMENAKLVGIADLNAKRAEEVARQFGVKKWFTDYIRFSPSFQVPKYKKHPGSSLQSRISLSQADFLSRLWFLGSSA